MIEVKGIGTVSGRVRFSIGDHGNVVDFEILTRKGRFQCESRLPGVIRYARTNELKKDDCVSLRGMLTEEEGDPVIYVRAIELTQRVGDRALLKRAE